MTRVLHQRTGYLHLNMLITWKSGLRGELCVATEELSHYNYELIKKHLDTIGERWKINPNTECDYELD